jgi:hypothetical protein
MARQPIIRYILKCPLRTLRFRLLVSLVIGYIAGGFVHAMFFWTHKVPFAERITNGIAESFLGVIVGGFPFGEYGTANTVNLWPYIAFTTAVVFFIWMVLGCLREDTPPRVD